MLQVKDRPDNLPTIGIAPVPKQAGIKVAPLPAQPKITIAKPKPQPKLSVQPLPQQPTIAVPPKPTQSKNMAKVANDINVARTRTTDDDLILSTLAQKNPDLVANIEEAKKRGANATQILDHIQQKYTVTPEPEPEKKSVSGFVKNLVSDAYNVGKGVVNVFRHPIDTTTGIAKLGYGELNKISEGLKSGNVESNRNLSGAVAAFDLINKIVPDSFKQSSDQVATGLNDIYLEKVKHPINTLYNEPVSTALDVATILGGGGGLLTKVASEGSTLAKVGELATKTGEALNPINTGIKATQKVLSVVSKVVKPTSEFAVSQATGLAPKTISTITENPEAFSSAAVAQTDRAGLGEKVFSAIEKRLENLSETGKGYEALRKSPEVVTVPKGGVEEILGKYGISLKDGKIITTKESIPLSAGDEAALQRFVDKFGKEGELSGNAFLNARTELSNMAKYDAAKTGASTTLSRELRSYFDSLGKKQLTGLAELDAKYAPEVKLLNKIKRDYLTPEGVLKDGALSKLANLTGKGKDQVLARLEKIVPGVTKDINILKAIEDIEVVQGQKVGAYLRGATSGFVLSGGNPAVAAITGILTQPAVAVQILRAYGKTAQIGGKVIESMVNKMQSGIKLTGQEKLIMQKALQAGTLYNTNN